MSLPLLTSSLIAFVKSPVSRLTPSVLNISPNAVAITFAFKFPNVPAIFSIALFPNEGSLPLGILNLKSKPNSSIDFTVY